MTDKKQPFGFSEEEIKIIKRDSKILASDLDYGKVAEYVHQFEEGKISIGKPEVQVHYPPNKKAAVSIIHNRQSCSISERSQKDVSHKALKNFGSGYLLIESNIGIVKEYDRYWVIEPTIEKILELDREKLKRLWDFINKFKKSGESTTLGQYTESFAAELPNWDPNSNSSSNIKVGLSIYRQAQEIFEIGFPLILGFKRILDGDEPLPSDLQTIRISKIIRELSDIEHNQNSAYFDLIANRYDKKLRNTVIHGDYTINPVDSQVEITSRNSIRNFEDVNDTLRNNFSIAVFLAGTWIAIAEWSYLISTNSDFSRDFLPI